jgi:hypothetical protein
LHDAGLPDLYRIGMIRPPAPPAAIPYPTIAMSPPPAARRPPP